MQITPAEIAELEKAMTQTRFDRLNKGATAAATTFAMVLALSGLAAAEPITKPMTWTPPSGMPEGPIPNTQATLEKGPFGAAMAVRSTGLTPGDVITIWWVAVQKPENCSASPCTPKDAMGNSAKVDSVVTLAAGGVVDADGTISLSSFLPKGEVEGNFFPTTLHSPETAEFHLPMHNHGPVDPDILDEMLTSFRAGCTDESLPEFYPLTALADGTAGSFDCKTVQVAIFGADE